MSGHLHGLVLSLMRQKDMHVSLDHPVRSICPCKAAIRYWIAAADKKCTKDGCSHCLVHDIAFDSLKVSNSLERLHIRALQLSASI